MNTTDRLRLGARLLLGAVLLVLAACGGGQDGPDPLAADTRLMAPKGSAPGLVDAALVAGAPALVNTVVSGDQTAWSIGALADGGYTIAWRSQGEPGNLPGPWRLHLQRHDAGGARVGGQVSVAFDSSRHPAPALAVLSDGSVLLAYAFANVVKVSSTELIVRKGIATERFDPTGAAAGGAVEVAFVEYNEMANPSFADMREPAGLALAEGGYLVSWKHFRQEPPYPPSFEFFVRRYDGTGMPLADERSVAVGGGGWGVQSVGFSGLPDGGYLGRFARLELGQHSVRFVPYDSAERTTAIPADGSAQPVDASLLALRLGGYVLWSSGSAGAEAWILDNDGALVAQPAIHAGTGAALADGSFVVFRPDTAAAQGGPNLLAQRHDPSGAPLGDQTRAGPVSGAPLIAPLAHVAVALAWTADLPASGKDVFAQLLRERGPSKRERVRACVAASKNLQGAEHRKFMSTCLKAP
jgi:hypothetical protein